MKKFLIFYLFSIFFTFNVNFAHSISPDVFIQSTVNRAAKTLGGDLSKNERIEKLKSIAEEAVDIKGIGFYSLGSHRKNLTKEELASYSEVFQKYFLKSFASRLAEYSNPEIEVNSKEIINKNYTIVSSTLVATETRPEVKIDWRVYTKDPNNLLIRDLIIEGLSLARTQKEEFSSIISSNDGKVEALIEVLNDFSISQ